MVLFSENLTSI